MSKESKIMNDETIMLRVANDELSFATLLFERYNVLIYNYFTRNTYNKMTSQDLTQNVFYRLIKYRKSFKKDYSFKPWIYRISRNVYIDYLKEENKINTNDIEEKQVADNLDENIIEKTEKKETEIKLNQALLKLSTTDREILILSKFQNVKYQEIAEILDLTESAVKVKVHRAIKKLREVYFKLEKV